MHSDIDRVLQSPVVADGIPLGSLILGRIPLIGRWIARWSGDQMPVARQCVGLLA